jgi:hypothetical protein
MKRRTFISTLGAALVWPVATRAQQPAKVARIGWLTAQRAASLESFIDAFRAGLASLGHSEGRNLSIEVRFGADDIGRVPALAAELVRHPVELIVAQGLAVEPHSRRASACRKRPGDRRRHGRRRGGLERGRGTSLCCLTPGSSSDAHHPRLPRSPDPQASGTKAGS